MRAIYIGLLLLLSACTDVGSSNIDNLKEQGGEPEVRSELRIAMEGDMTLPHSERPSGVQEGEGANDWSSAPRLNPNPLPDNWSAILAWGQVYATAMEPNPNVDYPLV
ncbi:MAG: hypothetical protein LBV09_07875, partial [Deferribacteraceae bacterium]|nr:hypothetical protein [Deferribacteraceae bacterium]